jgi:hypothetical protein
VKLPFVDRAAVPDAKLVNYLLDPVHPRGRSKAEFFQRLGFPAGRPDELRYPASDVEDG